MSVGWNDEGVGWYGVASEKAGEEKKIGAESETFRKIPDGFTDMGQGVAVKKVGSYQSDFGPKKVMLTYNYSSREKYIMFKAFEKNGFSEAEISG